MSAAFVLRRYSDPSGVSGLGIVAHGVEWDDGAVALHWPGKHPSTAVWGDMRDMEATHGHEGQTVVEYSDKDRLIKAYQQVAAVFLTDAWHLPVTAAPHPDHPDRLRLTFAASSIGWGYWIDQLGGSVDAATHEEVNGEVQHTWISPDGNLWLQYFSAKNDYPDHDAHDPRD